MLDKIKKMKIGGKEYSFEMTNRTILKVDEKYENYGSVLEGIMEGKQFYTNALKLISCSCIDKDFEVDELIDLLTPEQLNYEVPNFATELYFDYVGIGEKEDKEDDNKTEKN